MTIKPINDIFKFTKIMIKLNQEFNISIIPYYDDIEDKWSFATSDSDRYFSHEFEPAFKMVYDNFQDQISLICISNNMISYNSNYANYFWVTLFDLCLSGVKVEAPKTNYTTNIVNFPEPKGKTYSFSYTTKNNIPSNEIYRKAS